MTADTSATLPASIAKAIERAAAAIERPVALLSSAEQIRQQVQIVRGIAYNHGLDGVKAHKLTTPAANSVQVIMQPIAYVRKPKGYNAYILSLVDRWLTNKAASLSTNVSDVAALNENLGTAFNAANHFSARLTKSRLMDIKGAFSKHGLPFDAIKATTLSKVRAAAKACHVRTTAHHIFAGVGVRSGNTLVLGQNTYPIVMNGKRECIRVMIDGHRYRVYLAVLEWMANVFGLDEADPLSTTSTTSIGELAYSVKTIENMGVTASQISGLAYRENDSSANRPDAKLLSEKLEPATAEDERDPLELYD